MALQGGFKGILFNKTRRHGQTFSNRFRQGKSGKGEGKAQKTSRAMLDETLGPRDPSNRFSDHSGC